MILIEDCKRLTRTKNISSVPRHLCQKHRQQTMNQEMLVQYHDPRTDRGRYAVSSTINRDIVHKTALQETKLSNEANSTQVVEVRTALEIIPREADSYLHDPIDW